MITNRIALVVGINYYNIGVLNGCVNDANRIADLLERNNDEELSKNFDVNKLIAEDCSAPIDRSTLKDSIEELFQKEAEVALFYFAGHGYAESSGGYILASDSRRADDGLSLQVLINYATQSKARNKVIILDSCYSGALATLSNSDSLSAITHGVTILTSSRSNETSEEINNSGVFTNLLIDALEGGASNLLGDITPGSIYAHIDQSLGPWEQRPIFKTNTDSFICLRKTAPAIPHIELRQIAIFFPEEGSIYQLDPSYEPRNEGRTPEMPRSCPANNKKFSILQKYNRAGLLVPVDTEHMWNAAMESKGCRLTKLGEHYRYLAANDKF